MFTPELIDAIQAEASALGLKGATPISLAIRAALVERKREGKVPDERTRTYWVAGRYVAYGQAQPFEGAASVEGLNALASLVELPPDAFDSQIKAGRVNLARKGEAHFQYVTATAGANVPAEWYDLWVFHTEQAATLCAQSLRAGKIF